MEKKKKCRPLRKEEMKSLKDKWLIFKKTNVMTKIESFDFKEDEVYINNGWETLDNLLNNYVYEDGSPIGIEEELSMDGYTLEEFLKLSKNDCRNIATNTGIIAPNMDGTYPTVEYMIITFGLDKYKLKPKTKYIVPKAGFRGSVFGEASDGDDIWKKAECIAVSKKATFPFTCVNDKENPEGFEYFRTPTFSRDNQPTLGTRFTNGNMNTKIVPFDRVAGLSGNDIVGESGEKYYYKEVRFIDFDVISEDS